MSVENLVNILIQASQSREQRPKLISEFQSAVWNTPEDNSWEWEILTDLAYDLDFYEPNADLRAEDESYKDDEQAVQEIESALEKLQKVKHKL